jgi:hypothetical protein
MLQIPTKILSQRRDRQVAFLRVLLERRCDDRVEISAKGAARLLRDVDRIGHTGRHDLDLSP